MSTTNARGLAAVSALDVSCDAAVVPAPRSQLAFTFAPAAAPASPVVVTKPIAASVAPAPAVQSVSRTRALIDVVQAHLPGTRVVITDTRTVLLSQSIKDGARTVRVHQMFLDAPEHVRRAVGHFLAHGDKVSGGVVDAFIEAQAHLLGFVARPLRPDAHAGEIYDLRVLFAELNAAYFGDRIDAELCWGQAGHAARRTPGRKKRSITFGSWDARARRIVIHPVLDQREVPPLALARVLHHEMVHAAVGEERGPNGQRIVHGDTFHREEARFVGAQEADAWFDQHLEALLRWRPGRPLFGRVEVRR